MSFTQIYLSIYLRATLAEPARMSQNATKIVQVVIAQSEDATMSFSRRVSATVDNALKTMTQSLVN